mgnify:CR=1 FL=1
MKRIKILATTTLALLLAKRGPVVLLARDEQQARELTGERRNARYLPDVPLPVELDLACRFVDDEVAASYRLARHVRD